MIIDYEGGRIDIVEPLDFKRFSMRARHGQVLEDCEAVTFDGEHAWVSADVLRNWEALKATPEWQSGLAKMIAFARDHGWMNADDTRIRAHIERS